MAPINDICPPGTMKADGDGDVLFELGGSELKTFILVSSKVLTLTSPVFAAMFRNRFQEGTNLSSGCLHPIPLPDDDPAAFTLLCNILHHRSSEIPLAIDFDSLANLAILCDKYDCAGAVTCWSILWLQTWAQFAKEKGFERLLFISYGLDIPETFFQITLGLLKDYAGLPSFEASITGFDILPDTLTGISLTGISLTASEGL
jgi:hypothetical protein